MKQLLQNLRDGVTRVEEVPAPQARPGMALVRTAASLVSAGTERTVVEFAAKGLVGKARSRPDLVQQMLRKARQEGLLPTLRAAFRRLDQPMALGYSSAGVIVEAGPGLRGFQAGDRVACAGAGFASHAEYVVAPQNLLTRLPDTVDFESAAFTTLGAIAMQGLRLANPQLGERVAVIGLGLLGLLAAQMARAAGCQVLGIDVNPQRVALARSLGLTAVERSAAEETARQLSPLGYDSVLICADTPSNDPVTLAGALARDRACVVAVGAVGMDIPRRPYFDKELQFVVSRSYGPGRYDPSYEEQGHDYPPGYVRWTEGRNLQAFVELLADGRVSVLPLITHRIPIAEGEQAYELITGKRGEPFLGVLLTYPNAGEPTRVVPLPAAGRTTPLQGGVVAGVLGAGSYAGGMFLPVMKDAGGARLKTIASAAGLNAHSAARRFGFEAAASDEQAVLSDAEINTVVVLTRHAHHARQSLAALQNGKHVYCEKPPAMNQTELDELFQVLQAGGAPMFTVGYNRRFAPLGVRLRAAFTGRAEPLWMHYRVNAGELPTTHWLHDPTQGGGRIVGEGCHFVDFLVFLAGCLPRAVTAYALPDGDRYQQDNVTLAIEFTDGSTGLVSYLANGDRSLPKERLEVFCGGQSAVLDDFRRLELYSGGKRRSFAPAGGQNKGQRQAWEAFLAAVQSGQPPIPYDELYAVSMTTFATLESLRSRARCALDAAR